jgi:hypothetical protein
VTVCYYKPVVLLFSAGLGAVGALLSGQSQLRQQGSSEGFCFSFSLQFWLMFFYLWLGAVLDIVLVCLSVLVLLEEVGLI